MSGISNSNELEFAVFCIENIANAMNTAPEKVYDECIILERAAEHSELDGAPVGDIHTSVTTVAALLRVLQNLLRVVLVAVPSRPAAHLVFGTAAEFQQFQPVVLYKIKHPGNALVLCFPGVAECCSVDVDVQSAS